MMKNINEYFAAFVNKVAEETDSGENVDITDLIGYWNEEENQKEFAKLVKLVKTKSAKSSEKKMKDPNKPKRGKSAYLFFCQEMRPKVKTTMPADAKAPDVTARLGELWQELKGSTKASDKKKVKEYEAQAADDKKRYDDEMSGYERPSDEELEQMAAEKKKAGRKPSGKKGSAKSKRDPNKPKKNKSAYLFFCQDKRAAVKESLGDDAKNTEIVARLGELWNELKEESKNDDELKEHLDAYLEQAAEDKKRYDEEMANYEPSDESEDEKPTKKPAKKPAKKAAKKAKVVEEEEEEDPDATQPMAEEVVEEEEEKPKRKLPKFVTEKKTSEKKSSEKKSVKKLSAYTHFCQEHRAQVKEENPDFKATEVTKALSNMWKALDEEEKAEWKESAEAATQKQ
jgi:hypothetical protein